MRREKLNEKIISARPLRVGLLSLLHSTASLYQRQGAARRAFGLKSLKESKVFKCDHSLLLWSLSHSDSCVSWFLNFQWKWSTQFCLMHSFRENMYLYIQYFCYRPLQNPKFCQAAAMMSWLFHHHILSNRWKGKKLMKTSQSLRSATRWIQYHTKYKSSMATIATTWLGYIIYTPEK